MLIENDKERYYTQAVDIYGVLRALQNKRCSINLQFDSSALSFNSVILDVDSQENHILLDEIKPRQGHRLINSGIPFSIRASVDGIRVHASGLQATRTLNDQSSVLYIIPFPEKVLYLQRRDAFRTPVPVKLTVNASLYSNQHFDVMSAGLVDISMTGVCLCFTGEMSQALKIEDQFDLQISIPSLDQMFLCKAELRNQRFDSNCSRTLCGFRFINVNRIVQAILSRFIAQLHQESQTDL